MKVDKIIKCFLVLFIFICFHFIDINLYTNIVSAIITLLISLFFVYKTRKNLHLLIVSLFILYSNYSIVMGEYLIGGYLSASYTQVKNMYYYGICIRILLIFMSIITFFYREKEINITSKHNLTPKNNLVNFCLIICILLYILVFEVKRGNLVSYSVRITSLYGYSPILLLFAYYYSGNSILRKTIFVVLCFSFIIQDFYYGGRITSLQLIILLALTLFNKNLSFKNIVIYGLIGIYVNSLIGEYRSSYSLEGINFIDLFGKIMQRYFVFDTVVGAYYASATHVAAHGVVDINIRLDSFLEFIKSILIGSNNLISNVTLFISKNYFINGGGGLLPFHFYFWLGWLGVIVISSIVAFLFNRYNYVSGNNLKKLFYIAIVLRTPAWYLYSPINLFRGALIIVAFLYVIFESIDIMVKNAVSKRSILQTIKNINGT